MENYSVPPVIENTHKALRDLPSVQKALAFIEGDGEQTLAQQIEMALIPAPTFHEKEKALAFCEHMKALGLVDVHLDRFGNAIGLRKGSGRGPKVIVEAHMDTVFELATELKLRFEDGKVYLPGVCDDTSGMAAILSMVRALNDAGIETKGDLYCMGTVEEEGMGALGGMNKHMSENKYDAAISIDGSGFGRIVYQGTGLRTCEVNFYSKGGHAAGSFGKVSNSLYAAARAVVKIADIQVPPDSGTIYCVSNFHAGNDAAINAVATHSQIKINYRSHNQEYLVTLHDQILQAVQEACDEETARLGTDTVTWDLVQYVDIPAVTQEKDIPIVAGAYEVMKGLGLEPSFAVGGATNTTMAIYNSVPGVCIGSGGDSGGVHSTDEFYDPKDRHISTQGILLLALLLAGVDGETDPVA